jgi:hypothetical protein
MPAIMETKETIISMIQVDCHIITELWMATGIRKPTVMAIRKHGYRKVRARWVLKIIKHRKVKKKKKNLCAELFWRSKKNGVAFLEKIITGDEIWFHHYDPLPKIQRNGIISCCHAR